VVEEGQAMTPINPTGKTPQVVRQVLWVVASLSLLYFAWMMLDLVTHPFSPGNNLPSIPYLFRWLSAASGTFTVVAAVFIMRRVPGNINGLLLLIWGVGAAGWSLRADFGSPMATGTVQILFEIYFVCFSFSALDALIIHFPTGRAFPPRLSGWVWWLLLSSAAAGLLFILGSPSTPAMINPFYIPALSSYTSDLNIISYIVVIFVPSAALISLGLRFRAAGLIERQQIKWLLWLAGVGVIVTIATTVISSVSINGEPDSLATQITKVVGFIYWQAYPAVAIGIALLRHRLWNIDLIIRRTLVYGVLSGALALIYFGGVTLLQGLFTAITGQQSPASVVISTLLIAALFTPLLRRVQSFIDRRFYRPKYDAARALEEFSSAARREVELAHLTAELVGVVYKTVQPEQVSVWIRVMDDNPMEKK
jgi:hypothetical protein